METKQHPCVTIWRLQAPNGHKDVATYNQAVLDLSLHLRRDISSIIAMAAEEGASRSTVSVTAGDIRLRMGVIDSANFGFNEPDIRIEIQFAENDRPAPDFEPELARLLRNWINGAEVDRQLARARDIRGFAALEFEITFVAVTRRRINLPGSDSHNEAPLGVSICRV